MPDPTLHFRDATPRPATFDPAARTVEAIIATETPVERRDARGAFLEIIDMRSFDLASGKGAPVVDSHRRGSVRDVLGTVEDLWLEGTQLVARLRFSEAADVAPVLARVRDGTLGAFSIGYRVAAWEESHEG